MGSFIFSSKHHILWLEESGCRAASTARVGVVSTRLRLALVHSVEWRRTPLTLWTRASRRRAKLLIALGSYVMHCGQVPRSVCIVEVFPPEHDVTTVLHIAHCI